MFEKYNKTFRIRIPQISIKGKTYLSNADVSKLLNGNITILEKIDGANVGVIRKKDYFKLQKRGSLVDSSEHEQFGYFKMWSQVNHDRLMEIPKDTVLYGELTRCKHTIFYNDLPDHFLAFGWFNVKTRTFYHWEELEELCDKIGISTAPFIAQGSGFTKDELFDLIPDPSAYGSEPAEGIVAWNYKKQMRGKIVRAEFQEDIDKSGHWRHKKMVMNKLSKK